MLVEDFPGVVEQYVRFYQPDGNERTLLRSRRRSRLLDDTVRCGRQRLRCFTHEVVYGDPRTALTEPATIAISRRVAERYFGTANPVGRTLENAVGTPFTVTLVFEDLPANTISSTTRCSR